MNVVDVRRLALALPETTEVVTWGTDLTFRVRDKIFCITGEESRTASVKASREDQAELVAAAPQVYSIAPYVGRYGWVLVQLGRADAAELAELVTEAWRRTAPKRLVAAFDAGQPPTR